MNGGIGSQEQAFGREIAQSGNNRPENIEQDIREAEYVVDRGLEEFREILQGIDDYVIFASTGLYLYGKKYAIDTFALPPGDLDVNVFSEDSFERIRDRLRSIPTCHLEVFSRTGEDYDISSLDGAKILRGHLEVPGEQGGVNEYPFEFFLESSMIPEREDLRTDIRGMHTLTLEGLKRAYLNQYKVERRSLDLADQILVALLNPEVKQRMMSDSPEDGDERLRIQDMLGLSEEDIRSIYNRLEGLSLEDFKVIKKDTYFAIARQITDLKTKLDKRLRDIVNITDALDQA